MITRADRVTMAYSLESRSPWLDDRLAERSFGLPWRFSLQGRSGEHIFKEAMKAHVPVEVIGPRKMGFSVPLAEWFRSSLQPVFESRSV